MRFETDPNTSRASALMTKTDLAVVREGVTQAEARALAATAQDRAADRGRRQLSRWSA